MKNHKTTRCVSMMAALTAAVVAIATSLIPVQTAEAASGGDFNPGLIISDSLFYDGNAMRDAEVQAFLEAKVRSCASGFVCMKSAGQATPNMPAESGLCNAYTGSAWELASSIIAKVGAACGVSQRVLLVLLQKEQGLVTSTAPSQVKYNNATGFACPDTAPCDPAFSGFFYQVYYAARQFKIYKLRPERFNYRAGTYNSVLWHPNRACGSASVLIQNQATAGLYNYTPYQPNAAALANMYGTGDGCSSYGNRNFWAFYTDWFGPTYLGAGESAIAAGYEASGGASGPLGAAVSVPPCSSSATQCVAYYQNGAIWWTSWGGAWAVRGDIYQSYVADGGPSSIVGLPISPLYTYPENGGGTAQNFQSGSYFASEAGAFAVYGPVRVAYFATGGSSGPLGWPVAKEVCSLPDAGCMQTYQNGIVHSSTKGTGVMQGAILSGWKAAGGASALGYPVSPEYQYTFAGGGSAQNMSSGASVFASAAGAFALKGAIQVFYFSLGGSGGVLGWPTSNQVCSDAIHCRQTFQNGAIETDQSSTWVVSASIDAAYQAAGGPTGPLGMPISPVYDYTFNGGGSAQNYAGNASIFASAAGAFVIPNTIRVPYFAAGGSGGHLGWPTAASTCTGTTCSQTFQGGTIYSANGVGQVVTSKLDAAYRAAGGPTGPLGMPISPVYDYTFNGGGSAQNYAGNASIFASAAGAFVIPNTIRVPYFAAGGSGGHLGWPTAASTCTGTTCSQTFQGGTITAPRQ